MLTSARMPKELERLPFALSEDGTHAILDSELEGSTTIGHEDSKYNTGVLESWLSTALPALSKLTWRNPGGSLFNWGGYRFIGNVSELISA